MAQHTPFSRHLFNAIMGYMAIDMTVFTAKIIQRRLTGEAARRASILAAAPTTKFGWVQADLRGPLPPLDELDCLRVGASRETGHTLHLCRAAEAVGFASIERSIDFSEHYGESVYICSRPMQARTRVEPEPEPQTRARTLTLTPNPNPSPSPSPSPSPIPNP